MRRMSGRGRRSRTSVHVFHGTLGIFGFFVLDVGKPSREVRLISIIWHVHVLHSSVQRENLDHMFLSDIPRQSTNMYLARFGSWASLSFLR